MKKTTMMGATVLAAALLNSVGITTAQAADRAPDSTVIEGGASADNAKLTRNGTAFPEGGTWSWGTWDGQVHSLYMHHNSTHRASVRSNGILQRTDWMPPSKLAYAHRPKAISGNESFYAKRG